MSKPYASHDVRPMCPAETAAEIAFWVAQDMGQEFAIACGGCIVFLADKDSCPEKLLETHRENCTLFNQDPSFVFHLSTTPSNLELCAA